MFDPRQKDDDDQAALVSVEAGQRQSGQQMPDGMTLKPCVWAAKFSGPPRRAVAASPASRRFPFPLRAQVQRKSSRALSRPGSRTTVSVQSPAEPLASASALQTIVPERSDSAEPQQPNHLFDVHFPLIASDCFSQTPSATSRCSSAG